MNDRLFARPDIAQETRADGTIILKSRMPLGAPARSIGDWLAHWGKADPGRLFMAERGKDGQWMRLTYGDALQKVRAAGAWMLANGLSQDHPLAILSDNSIDHAILSLGAIYVGVPAATISQAYSLLSTDHERIKAMVGLLEPGAVYASDTARFGPALKAIAPLHAGKVITSADDGTAGPVVAMDALLSAREDAAVDAAHAAITPDTIARLLFTSGSTGLPKAVINTHRMLTANQEMRAACWPFLADEPPVIVDWLPWSHTFGANHNLNMILRNGGTIYIDAGRPAPGAINATVANLAKVGPNICFNVPRGYAMMADALEADPDAAKRFFSAVKIIFYAAAALPQTTWDKLQDLSMKAVGRKPALVSAWGSTETAPLATDCHFQATRSGNIGVPVPGVELKLVPNAGKMEVRVRGPNVTPGYYRNEPQTRAAFDEEGFYLIGDAMKLADPADPSMGLYFDGRVAEDFKLSTGTFVHVGQIRVAGIDALAPLAQDIVVTGHNRDAVGFLIFPNMVVARKLSGLGEDAPAGDVLAHPAVREHAARGLAALKAEGGGSSRFATRARLMAAPPSVDAGEINDKGYINQRAVLSNRPEELAALEGDDPNGFILPA
ncbi:MAG: feruloyl-CoA synthase [Notoacmeibacter sp.]|nr:feruloyl-CoA synthase [Notoacmeibacter sp.]